MLALDRTIGGIAPIVAETADLVVPRVDMLEAPLLPVATQPFHWERQEQERAPNEGLGWVPRWVQGVAQGPELGKGLG